MSKEKSFISAVIYVHNAEKCIAYLLKNVIQTLEDNFEQSEIICVNDFSADSSVKEIRKAAAGAGTTVVSILNMSYFHGIEMAMNAGVDLAIGDFVLEMDSPVLDYSPLEIMRVYQRAKDGYDIVNAAADKKQRLSSKMFYWLYEKCTNGNQRMRTVTFSLLSRRAINRISNISRTIPYRKGVYMNSGLKMDTLQYQVAESGELLHPDYQIKQYRNNLALETLLLFTDVGYYFSKFMSGIMLFASLFMIVYTIAVYVMSKPIEGWTTIVLFLAVGFLGIFMMMTVIIKYLQILLELNFKRTTYSFESVEKITK